MRLTEFVVSLVVATGTAAAAYTALDLPALAAGTTATVRRADCRAVDTAIAGYTAEHGVPPTRAADLGPYLSGDLSGYRITAAATAAGPGCDGPPH